MATKKGKKESFPKIVKGSHLTVITHEDGRTELVWDDEQLAKDVREAIASYENSKEPKNNTKKSKKTK